MITVVYVKLRNGAASHVLHLLDIGLDHDHAIGDDGAHWLFEDFEDANLGEGPEILSDHPGNDARIHALQDHFSEQPSVFSKFNWDRKGATPFRVPEEVPVIFLRIAPRAEARK
jgi:hypothetical protein